jgi:hypothetical protein
LKSPSLIKKGRRKTKPIKKRENKISLDGNSSEAYFTNTPIKAMLM